mmetsp:Transcript_65701/g.174095  ORF Transcript_65701/g.174095 Transcript_65701/m.174095 type:complete len:255 (+) Transcript_65701:967-1731(+)
MEHLSHKSKSQPMQRKRQVATYSCTWHTSQAQPTPAPRPNTRQRSNKWCFQHLNCSGFALIGSDADSGTPSRVVCLSDGSSCGDSSVTHLSSSSETLRAFPCVENAGNSGNRSASGPSVAFDSLWSCGGSEPVGDCSGAGSTCNGSNPNRGKDWSRSGDGGFSISGSCIMETLGNSDNGAEATDCNLVSCCRREMPSNSKRAQRARSSAITSSFPLVRAELTSESSSSSLKLNESSVSLGDGWGETASMNSSQP